MVTLGNSSSRAAAAVIAAMPFLISPAQAQSTAASQDHWYGGLDISRTHLSLNGGDIDRAFAGQGITSATSLDRFVNIGDSSTTGRTDVDQLGVGLGVRF